MRLDQGTVMNVDTVIGELVAYVLATHIAESNEDEDDEAAAVEACVIRNLVFRRLCRAVLATIDQPGSMIASDCRDDLRSLVHFTRGLP